MGVLMSCRNTRRTIYGIVKNISYMGHITIPTNSSPLYSYILPKIKCVDDYKPKEFDDKVKVFINGFAGNYRRTYGAYEYLKQQKYKGIINIYTSISFNFKPRNTYLQRYESTRPVLKVRDNKVSF